MVFTEAETFHLEDKLLKTGDRKSKIKKKKTGYFKTGCLQGGSYKGSETSHASKKFLNT